MAKRRSDLLSTNGIQSTDLYSTISQEKRILTATLEKVEDVKNSPINRLSGAKTQIVYFHQVPRDNNDFLVNVSAFSSGDPNLTHYVMIKNLYVKMNQINTNMEDTEGNGPKTPMFEGEFQLMPNTFLPHVNDYFTMGYQGRTCLFKVTDAAPVTANSDTAYNINFALQYDNFTYENSELSKSVVEEYVFEESRIGTDSRTIFRSSEYDYIQDLKHFYNDLGEIYLRDFYDPILSTFLLTYENNISRTDPYKFTIISENDDNVIPDNKTWTDRFIGKRMYDAELIDFIRKNNIFHEWEDKCYTPTQYARNPRPSRYNNTVFYAIEKQDKSSFRSKYFIPLEISLASPNAQPVMFGTVNLVHTSSRTEDTIDLLPKYLFNFINTIKNDRSAPESFTGNVFEQMAFIIALHVLKKEEKIFTALVKLYESIDDIRSYDDTIQYNEAFYLFPLIGYVIKEVLVNLQSKEVVNKYKDPKDYIPK